MSPLYLHTIEGRVRVKVPGVKGAPARARDLERRLSTQAAVRSVRVSATTGNALIHYDKRASLSDVQAWVRDWLVQTGQATPLAPFTVRTPSPSLSGKVVAAIGQTAAELALRKFLLA